MYNTIEVMKVDISRIEIAYVHQSGFVSRTMENIKHVKVLPWLSVVQSVEGSYDIALGNQKSEATGAGGFFIAPSDVRQTIVHHADPQSGRMNCRWVFLDAVINGSYHLDYLYDFPMTVPQKERAELHLIFDELFETDNAFDRYSCYYRILKVLMQVAVPKQDPVPKALQDTMDYIGGHFASEIRIDELAANAHMSPSHFYTVFKKRFGISPIAYINRYRLSLAAEYLQNSALTVAEVGRLVGVEDPLYFSKMFCKAYGASPREYRKKYRQDIDLNPTKHNKGDLGK